MGKLAEISNLILEY